MKNLSVIRSFAAVASLVAAFVFVGCSDDSSPIESDTSEILSSDDAEIESSSSAKLEEEPASSSSKKVRSSSFEEEEELSSSSKKEKKSSSSSVENEENSSSSEEEEFSSGSLEDSSSSDADEPVVIVPVQQDVSIAASDLDYRISGDDVRFKGRFSLDVTESVNNNDNVAFTGITFMVAKGSDVRSLVQTAVTVNVNTILFPTMNVIDLNSMSSAGVSISLLDPGFNDECGIYSLIVTVTASNGVAAFMRTEVIPFEREAAEYCRNTYSSSSVAQSIEIPMASCEVELSTNLNPGLDFASCTAVPAPATTADNIFSKAGTRDYPEVSATSGNGTLFGPICNGDDNVYTDDYEVNMWPEDMNPGRSPATAYVSDFKYRVLGPTLTGMIENINQIYVAATTAHNQDTGAGFYAFAITDARQGNDGDFSLTIKVYKAQ